MRSKSICFVTTGDIQKIAMAKRALGLANPLVELGWKVSILMDDTPENRHRASLECSNDVSVFFNRYKSIINEIVVKSKIIKQLSPSIVYNCAPALRDLIIIPSKTSLVTEHSELTTKMEHIKGINYLKFLFLEFYSIFKSDALINASKFLQTFFKKRADSVGKSKLPMLYLPYAFNFKSSFIEHVGSFKFTKGKNDKYIVYLGSLDRTYGAFTMLGAFERIKKSNRNIKLVLCGKGADYENVKKIVRTHKLEDTVFVRGFVPEEDIPYYFSLADAFLSPMNNTIKDWARCPSKLYMYLPYNKPVITCKIGEPYEVLKDKGFYFEPSDELSLANTILQLYDDNIWKVDYQSSLHEWKQRAVVLDEFLKKYVL